MTENVAKDTGGLIGQMRRKAGRDMLRKAAVNEAFVRNVEQRLGGASWDSLDHLVVCLAVAEELEGQGWRYMALPEA